MANMIIVRKDVYDATIIRALQRVVALKASDIDENYGVSLLIDNLQMHRFCLVGMIKRQVIKYGGVWNNFEPLNYTFAVQQDEDDFNAWLGTFGTDTYCPTRVDHSENPSVTCWDIFDVNVLEEPDSGDVTLLVDVITVIDGS